MTYLSQAIMVKKFGIDSDGGQLEEQYYGHKVYIIEKVLNQKKSEKIRDQYFGS